MLSRERRPALADEWPAKARRVYRAFEGIEYGSVRPSKASDAVEEARWEQFEPSEWMTEVTRVMLAFQKCRAKDVIVLVTLEEEDPFLYRWSRGNVREIKLSAEERRALRALSPPRQFVHATKLASKALRTRRVPL